MFFNKTPTVDLGQLLDVAGKVFVIGLTTLVGLLKGKWYNS